MQVILLERVEKLGQMGDEVKVKDGFARQLPAAAEEGAARDEGRTANISRPQKSQLEARNLERKSEAQKVAEKLEGQIFMLLRQAGDRGQLYGSVSPRDIAEVITKGGFSVGRGQVPLDKAIKDIGLVPVTVVLQSGSPRRRDDQRRAHRGRGRAPGARRNVLAEQAEAEEVQAAAEELFEEGAGPKEETAQEDDAAQA